MFIYDIDLSANSNAAPNTETDHLLGTAGATIAFIIMGIYGNIRTGLTVGAAALRCKTAGTSTVGAGATANKRHPNNPANSSVWLSGVTTAGAPLVRMSVGMSQTGGQNQWQAISPDFGIYVLATTKGELFSIANIAAQGIDMGMEFAE